MSLPRGLEAAPGHIAGEESLADGLSRLLERHPSASETHAARAALARLSDVLVQSGADRGLLFSRLISNRRETVGRADTCSIRIYDRFVSHAHLELECAQGCWYAHDMRSTNGTRLDGQPLIGWERLRHGDLLSLGEYSRLLFLQPCPPQATPGPADRFLPESELTLAGRRILWAMSLPMREDPDAGAATRRQVADSLGLSEDTVKTQTSQLYTTAGIDGRRPGARDLLARRGLLVTASQVGESDHPGG